MWIAGLCGFGISFKAIVEQPLGHALNADQPGPLHVDQGHPVDAGKAAHAAVRLRVGDGGRVDARPPEGGVERVPDVDRDLRVAHDGRLHSLGVDDLGTKVRELPGLVV